MAGDSGGNGTRGKGVCRRQGLPNIVNCSRPTSSSLYIVTLEIGNLLFLLFRYHHSLTCQLSATTLSNCSVNTTPLTSMTTTITTPSSTPTPPKPPTLQPFPKSLTALLRCQENPLSIMSSDSDDYLFQNGQLRPNYFQSVSVYSISSIHSPMKEDDMMISMSSISSLFAGYKS